MCRLCHAQPATCNTYAHPALGATKPTVDTDALPHEFGSIRVGSTWEPTVKMVLGLYLVSINESPWLVIYRLDPLVMAGLNLEYETAKHVRECIRKFWQSDEDLNRAGQVEIPAGEGKFATPARFMTWP